MRESISDFFCAPFNWNTRSTRKEFCIGYAIQFVITFIIGIFMIATLFLYGTVNTNNTGWSAPVVRVTITVGILHLFYSMGMDEVKLIGSCCSIFHGTANSRGTRKMGHIFICKA